MAVLLNINKFNYPFTLKQKSFLENFFKFAPPYIQTVLMLRSYKKGSRLVAAGDSCAHVYILLKGRLVAVEEHVANIPYHFTEIRALDIVGDYEFFTEKQPRLVTLATLEDSLCLVIPAIEYMTWLRKDPHALFLRSRMIISQLVVQAQFQRQNLFADNRTRMLVFLKEQATQAVNDSMHNENGTGNTKTRSVYPIRIPFTRPEIAAHLGCSVRTVNRTVQELAKENMIYLNKGKIFISEPQTKKLL